MGVSKKRKEMMDNIKAVLFDFDDTLGNRNGYAYYMYDNFIRTYLSDIYDNKLLKRTLIWIILSKFVPKNNFHA